ncbi:MAG: hypothetical protein D4R56_03575 [Deltaproteobacteria bacterium]|nr:MAG: hypothetical protein D4R56_03575 [Deltaproteobacteria bacterium]
MASSPKANAAETERANPLIIAAPLRLLDPDLSRGNADGCGHDIASLFDFLPSHPGGCYCGHRPLAEIVYQHHERMDCSGCPTNLKG